METLLGKEVKLVKGKLYVGDTYIYHSWQDYGETAVEQLTYIISEVMFRLLDNFGMMDATMSLVVKSRICFAFNVPDSLQSLDDILKEAMN